MKRNGHQTILALCLILFLVGCEEEVASPLSNDTSPDTDPHLPNSSGGSGAPGESGNIELSGTDGGDDEGSLGGFVSDRFTQENYSEAYDFLWVVDNSGSMSNIRSFMSQNLTEFVNVLESRQSLDWQMAVTITDHVDYNGNLVNGNDGIRVVGKDSAQASDDWRSIINSIPSTSHAGWEQGLESAYAAIKHHGNEFNREGVPLIVTYVTDEEDYSCESQCNGFSGLPENQSNWNAYSTDRYVNQFRALKVDRDVDVIIYPIVHLVPLGVDCDDDYGFVGSRYMHVQEEMGTGASLSLCQDQLVESFDRVAQLTANRSACFTLTRIVLEIDTMIVWVNGDSVDPSATEGYVFEASDNAVCFNGSFIPGNGDEIQVTYRSLEN